MLSTKFEIQFNDKKIKDFHYIRHTISGEDLHELMDEAEAMTLAITGKKISHWKSEVDDFNKIVRYVGVSKGKLETSVFVRIYMDRLVSH